MKKLFIALLILGLLTSPVHADVFDIFKSFFNQNTNLGGSALTAFQGGTGSTSPSGILVGDSSIRLKTLVIGSNLSFDGVTLSAAGGGGVFPFTPTGYGVSTSTTVGFLNGLLSTASSTFNSPLRLPTLSQGLSYIGTGGLIGSTATTSATCSGATSCTGFTVIGSSPITITSTDNTASTTLLGDNNTWTGDNTFARSTSTQATSSNLAVTTAFNFLGTVITNVSTWFNGLFDTQFATKDTDDLVEGATNKYDETVVLTQGGATTITGTYPNFTISSTDNTASTTLLGDNNTFTGTNRFGALFVDTFSLDLTGNATLSGTNTGDVTLTGEDYLSLSGQQITANAIDPDNLSASDFGSFTCNGTTCTIDNGAVSNAMLVNSTISGKALGTNLDSLSNGSTLLGSSYNGSATVSDWDIDLSHGNVWTPASTTFVNGVTIGNGTTTNATSTTLAITGSGTSTRITNNLNVGGNINVGGSATSTFANGISITGGCFAINNVCLSAGTGSPGGADSAVQYNNGGAFGGDASQFVWDDTNNRLGIGTTSPSASLAIHAGAGSTTLDIASTSGTILNVSSTGGVGIGTTTTSKLFYVFGNTTGGIGRFHRRLSNTTGTIGTVDFLAESTGQMTDGFGNGLNFYLQDADGVINTAAQIIAYRDGADNSGSLSFAPTFGGASANALVLRNRAQGIAGIGTTTPVGLLNLTVRGTLAPMPQLVISDMGLGTDIKHIYASTTADGSLNWGRMNDAYALGTAQFTMGVNGRFGIGTTTPGTALSVSGDGVITGTTTTLGIVATGTATSTFAGGLQASRMNATASSTFAGLSVLSGGLKIANFTNNSFLGIGTNGDLRSTTTSAWITNAITDETGTGGLVFSTSPTFTTSATSPILYGGSAAGSTLTLRSTSGAGVGADAIILGVGNNGAVERERLTLGGIGNGTTTPRWNLQIASSTKAQLALSDGSLTSNHWTFRNSTGWLYIATSSPSTFATSTFAALTITPGGQLSILESIIATSTAQVVDWNTTSNQVLVRIGTSATTIGFNNASTTGMTKRIIVCNPTATAGAITWSVATIRWTGGTVPAQTTTANKCDLYSFTISAGATTTIIIGAQTPNI